MHHHGISPRIDTMACTDWLGVEAGGLALSIARTADELEALQRLR